MQPAPVFLPGKFHGQRSLVGYSSCGCKELDTTEWLNICDTHNRYMTYKTIDQYFHNLNSILCTFHCSKTVVKMQEWLLSHEKIIHANFDNEIEQRETINTEKYSSENNILYYIYIQLAVYIFFLYMFIYK